MKNKNNNNNKKTASIQGWVVGFRSIVRLWDLDLYWLVVGFKADCLTRDLGQCVECPPWGFF